MPELRVLIVDDEPLARDRIREMLARETGVAVVGEARNGAEAAVLAAEHDPDLVFLNVQMPEVDGFGVLAAVRDTRLPAVIFVTAYDEYALKAFEVHAQDYLLKPFDADRFHSAFRRAADRIRSERTNTSHERLLTLLEGIERERPRRTRIPIRSGGSIFFLPVEDIDWIEAADNYVRIHSKGDVHVLRQTLQHMEESLGAQSFVRIHRSSIVNVDRIREIQPWFGGEYVILLRDGTKLQTSRRYRSRLEAFIQ